MSENGGETPDAPFDPATLTPQDAPFPPDPIPFPVPVPTPDEDEHITPDHTASEDPRLSIVERVKARAKDNGAKDAPKSAPKAKKRVPASRPGALVRPLADIYTSIGMVLVPFDPACGMALVDSAQKCAESLDALAQRNDSVRRLLLALTETSAWGGVLTAHLPLLLVIVAHHGPREVSEKVAPLAAMMNPNLGANMEAAQPEGEQRAG